MKFYLLIGVLALFGFSSCGTKEKKQEEKPVQKQKQEINNQETGWEDVLSSVVKIDSYDGDRILESGQGFFVAEDLIVTKYSLVNRADNVQVSPLDTNEKFKSNKYVAFDRINDLIVLKVENIKRKPVELYSGTVPNSAKAITFRPHLQKPFNFLPGKF